MGDPGSCSLISCGHFVTNLVSDHLIETGVWRILENITLLNQFRVLDSRMRSDEDPGKPVQNESNEILER